MTKITRSLADAIAAFKAADAALPEGSPDDVMDAAVDHASDLLACVIAIPARTDHDVLAKLTLAIELVEWDARTALVRTALAEQAAIEDGRDWDIAEDMRRMLAA